MTEDVRLASISLRLAHELIFDLLVRVRIVQHVETKTYAAVKIVPRPRDLASRYDRLATPTETPILSDEMLQSLEREIVIMKLVSHPNLLSLYDVWESKREM